MILLQATRGDETRELWYGARETAETFAAVHRATGWHVTILDTREA